MRKISLVLVVFAALAVLPLTAEPVRRDREERVSRARIVRIIKAFLGFQTNGDGITPPVPAAPRP